MTADLPAPPSVEGARLSTRGKALFVGLFLASVPVIYLLSEGAEIWQRGGKMTSLATLAAGPLALILAALVWRVLPWLGFGVLSAAAGVYAFVGIKALVFGIGFPIALPIGAVLCVVAYAMLRLGLRCLADNQEARA